MRARAQSASCSFLNPGPITEGREFIGNKCFEPLKTSSETCKTRLQSLYSKKDSKGFLKGVQAVTQTCQSNHADGSIDPNSIKILQRFKLSPMKGINVQLREFPRFLPESSEASEQIPKVKASIRFCRILTVKTSSRSLCFNFQNLVYLLE